jgi:putative endopeptidase
MGVEVTTTSGGEYCPCEPAAHKRAAWVAWASAVLALILPPLTTRAAEPGAVETPPPLAVGLNLEALDRSVRPQDDFYRFANGASGATSIGPDSLTHAALLVREFAAAADKTAGSDAQKIGDLYASINDEAQAGSVGLIPLIEELNKIDAIRSPAQLVHYFGYAHRTGATGPLFVGAGRDPELATHYLATLKPAGLSLGTREAYLSPDARFAAQRAALHTYCEQLLALAGVTDAKSAARRIEALETRLANYQASEVQARVAVRPRRMTIAELQAFAPGVDWYQFLQGAAAAPVVVAVEQPAYVAGLALLVRTVPVNDWRAYFKFRLLDHYAPYLPQRFRELRTARFQAERIVTVTGASDAAPQVSELLRPLVERAYLQRYFDLDRRAAAQKLIANIVAAVDAQIASDVARRATDRNSARARLATLALRVAHPDEWSDYTALVVRSTDAVGNVRRLRELQASSEVRRSGMRITDDTWPVPVFDAAVRYDVANNELFVTAGALQAPWWSAGVDDAANYGAIGVVVARELTRELMTLPTAEATEAAALQAAHAAYRFSLAAAPAPVLDGLTGEQRLLVVWAQMARNGGPLFKPSSPSPDRFSSGQVNAIVGGLPAFRAAFGLQPTDKLHRAP